MAVYLTTNPPTGSPSLQSIAQQAAGVAAAAAVAQIQAGAPSALDTLKELADALGDDANYALDIANALAGKAAALSTAAVKTAAYMTPGNEIIPVDATAAPVTITLPTAPADKTRATIKKIDASTNLVTIARGGSTDVFNKTGGSTTLTLTLLNQSTTVQYVAATGLWYIVAGDLPLSQLDARYATSASIAATFAPLADAPLTGAPTVNGSPIATQDDAIAFAVAL